MFDEWFLPSLLNQTTEDERKDIEILFIYSEAKELLCRREFGFNKILITGPKKNIYQGPYRKTKTEMFSPSNARNTGILLSEGTYLVFADDVAVLMPSWWNSVKEAAARNLIVCGSYQKHFEMEVENGVLVKSRYHEMGKDSRWKDGNDHHPVSIPGQSLFGCSLGIPAKDIIDVNGFDELCDSIGGEDYHLGIRLNNAGKKVWYDRRMLTIESEELHSQPFLMLRDDRLLPDGEYMKKLKEFNVHRRLAPGRPDSSHMILDILLGLRQTKTIYNNYSIAADRPNKYCFPPPDVTTHWFDNKPLAEI